jgi:threonine synthase
MTYQPRSYIGSVLCLECETRFEYYPGLDRCPECGGVWLDATYDYEAVASIWHAGLSGRPYSLWRYLELLPVLNTDNIISIGEGHTPLFRAEKLQHRLGHPAIYIKDERQSPTSSFKDRQAAVAVTNLVHAGIRSVFWLLPAMPLLLIQLIRPGLI